MSDKINPCHYKSVISFDLTDEEIEEGVVRLELADLFEKLLTEEEFCGHLKGNIIKYVTRLGRKDDIDDDLQKARWYLNHLETILKKEGRRKTKNVMKDQKRELQRWVDKPIEVFVT